MSKLLKVLFLLFPFSIIAQVQDTSYFQKFDASGIDVNEYFPQLNIAAKHLRDSLPTQYKNNFKVFGYGFYLMAMQTQGGLEYSLEEVKQRAEATGNYYLTISKEPSTDNIYAKFHVGLKLPDEGIFSCINNGKLELLRLKIQALINNKYNNLGSSYDYYAEAEITGMKELSKIISQIKKGNCTLLDKDIKLILKEKKFKQSFVYGKSYQLPVSKSVSNAGNPNVNNIAKLDFKIKDSVSFIPIIDESFLSNFAIKPHIIITSNNDFENNNTASADLEFNNSQYKSVVWINIFENSNPNGFDTLYFKVKALPEQGYDPAYEDFCCTCNKSGTLPLPYKKTEFENIVKNFDKSFYDAFDKSTCASLSSLQKNAWTNQWDRGFIGVPGEVIILERWKDIFSPTVVQTAIGKFKKDGTPWGAAEGAAYAFANTTVTHSPDKFTDILINLNLNSNVTFVIDYYDTKRDF